MKRIASLFLTLTLVYNVLGCYMMISDKQEYSWIASMEKIDNSNFELIKININPYAYIVDSGFEYENKDVVVNNKIYHVFKNRIVNNVLHLYCLKNKHQNIISKKIKNAIDNQLFDTSSKENPSKKLLKSFTKDYIANQEISFNCNNTVHTYFVGHFIMYQQELLLGYFTINYSPPELV